MNTESDHLIALSAVFSAAIQVDKIANSGKANNDVCHTLLYSLLIRDANSTLEIYDNSDATLHEGYRLLKQILLRNPTQLKTNIFNYVLTLIYLEKKLANRPDLLNLMGQRIDQIQQQVNHFGLMHNNVIANCASLYQETISTFTKRIQVKGEANYLQQTNNAEQIRALLLTGIRSARLWRQLGGSRWQLIFQQKKLLQQFKNIQKI
ncbi:UNVERIFIED_CONTAM: hypothetical protein GTU68_008610 [Idotea baltica]|nr:hypothetical protein [Idotea baltica]